MRIDTLDLGFQNAPHVIAAFVLHGPDGPVLIETGPVTTLPKLHSELARCGVDPGDVRDVLVTHIHLDHSGAAGWWARQGARVWVHPVGAPHLVDPSKLMASAERIYGDRMQALWGEVLPAPAEKVMAVEDGARIEAGGLSIEVVETPGHAWHHHLYRVGDVAFAGDAAGILLPGNAWIDLPAPPPEFDLPTWKTTLERIRGLGLKTLYRTHFGPGVDAEDELRRFEEILDSSVDWVVELLDRGLERDAVVEEFSARMRGRAAEIGIDEADARAYELANPRSMSVDGISRFLRRKKRN
jgi:glyoxylase-like metal-dependent hydrolase (beta-lactamase superfamily II)